MTSKELTIHRGVRIVATHQPGDPEPDEAEDTWACRIKDLALAMEAADPRLLNLAHELGQLADRVEYREERMRQEDR